MLKLGSWIIDPEGNDGFVERYSRKTGSLLVRINDRWFLASECEAG